MTRILKILFSVIALWWFITGIPLVDIIIRDVPMPVGEIKIQKWHDKSYMVITSPIPTPMDGTFVLQDRHLTTSEITMLSHELLKYISFGEKV